MHKNNLTKVFGFNTLTAEKLYTRYPIVARALGLAAALGRVRARAKESCIQAEKLN